MSRPLCRLGQSGEAGGKAHFAGVGFGGENAIVQALDIAFEGHGYGVDDFRYRVLTQRDSNQLKN